jgi:hypothetical protein
MKQFKVYLIVFSSLLFVLSTAKAADDIGMLGLHDFSLGNNIKPQEQNIEETQQLCVYSIPSGKYQIEFMSSDHKIFYMQSDKHKVPVKIYWNDIELQPNTPLIFTTGAKVRPTTNCQNVKLTYKIQNMNHTKTAGSYRENMHFKLVKIA